MHKKFFTVTGLIVCSLWLSSNVGQAQPKEPTDYLALVVELKGEVQVQRKDSHEFTKVVWGNYIYQGDLVKAGNEAQVSLLFANGTMIELSANSQMVIKQHPGLKPDETTNSTNETEKVIPQLSRLQMKSFSFEKPEIQVASDGSHRLIPTIRSAETDTILISPRMTTISVPEPEFKWNFTVPDAEYKISLSNAKETIWTTTTRQTGIKCPAHLKRGESYLWTLTAYQGLRRIHGPVSTQFKVLSQTEYEDFTRLLKKMQNLDAGKRSKNYYHLILGFTYLKFDLIEKAIPHLKTLALENPEAPFPQEALCRLYLNQQMPEAAQKHFRQWRALLTEEQLKENEKIKSHEKLAPLD